MKHLLLFSLLLSIFLSSFCQDKKYTQLEGAFSYTIDYPSLLKSILSNNSVTIKTSNSNRTTFRLTQSNTLAEELREKYPSIHSFRGETLNKNHLTIRLDINENGINGWINGNENLFFKTINKQELLVYSEFEYRKAYPKKKNNEEILFHHEAPSTERKTHQRSKSYAGTLRTYRLAVACTGEYASYHGASKSLALSAISTTINRINEVYERDLGIRFELVPNNDEIIFLNSLTDPFTNDNPDALITEGQSEIDNIIGVENYDIGHTFSTEGGGLADWASVCGSYKAGGITGTVNPIGDPYDIDYVAHEIGHQFGADHTFHSETGNCNTTKVQTSAYEVGSGSTIMAYAGLCDEHNIQTNSSSYFHAKSIEAIQLYLAGRGGTCGTETNNNNTAPVIQLKTNSYSIPTSTPFELSANASDNEDTTITYCWEQYDLGNGNDPLNPSGNDPLFRSFDPINSETRMFPQLSDILNNTSSLGEYLPNYERTLNFRITARDNHSGGGGTNYESMKITTVNTSTPFQITSQNTPLSYTTNQRIKVTWDVANTNNAPINAEKVNIYLSLDGGLNFSSVLKNTPNDGNEIIQLPSTITTNGRIKIKPTNNIFFNINESAFQITPPTYPSFGMVSYSDNNLACANDSIKITIETTSFSGFNSPISISFPNLPNGIIAPTSVITPGNTLTLYISSNSFSGNLNLEISAIADTIAINNTIPLKFHGSNNLSTPTIEFPIDQNIDISNKPEFKWSVPPLTDYYTFQISENDNFTLPITLDFITKNSILYPKHLTPLTTYYWKVKAQNNCATSIYSNTSSFTTAPTNCETYLYDTPLPLQNGQSDFYASINISNPNTITSVSIPNIKGTHEWTSDLYLSLIAPNQEEISLFGYICDGNFSEDFNVGFNDTSNLGIAPCPITDGLIYSTSKPFNILNGENAAGEWQLHIYDEFPAADAGILLSWELEVCTENNITPIETTINATTHCYPNPTKNILNISTLDPLEEIAIVNSMGQIVLSAQQSPIDISELPSGIYLYVAKIKKRTTRGTFQKIK